MKNISLFMSSEIPTDKSRELPTSFPYLFLPTFYTSSEEKSKRSNLQRNPYIPSFSGRPVGATHPRLLTDHADLNSFLPTEISRDIYPSDSHRSPQEALTSGILKLSATAGSVPERSY